MQIELTNEEHKALKALYAAYMDSNSDDYSREERLAIRQECQVEYIEKFPHVAAEVAHIRDVEKLVYSPNQLKFIEDALDCNLDIDYTYSGRGMFGDTCPAVRVGCANDIATKAKVYTDSMGLGVVVYAQY